MSQFLSAVPASGTFVFESPRSTTVSASGLVVGTHRAMGYWRGSFRFPANRGRENNPLLSLTLGDRPNAGFFVDLVEGERQPTSAPTWYTGAANSTVRRIALDAEHHSTGLHPVAAGDLISMRQSGFPPFVSARRITALEVDGTDVYAVLDTQLPEEFFPVAAGTEFQYCVDRPHVRAIFAQSPQRWQKNSAVLMNTSTVSWIEDTSGTTLALRSISGTTGVEPNALLTNDGQPLLITGGSLDGQTLTI